MENPRFKVVTAKDAKQLEVNLNHPEIGGAPNYRVTQLVITAAGLLVAVLENKESHIETPEIH